MSVKRSTKYFLCKITQKVLPCYTTHNRSTAQRDKKISWEKKSKSFPIVLCKNTVFFDFKKKRYPETLNQSN